MRCGFLLCYYFKSLNKIPLFEVVLLLRIIIGITLGVWLLLILIGKGGFVHLLLLVAAGVATVEILRIYRSNMREKAG